MFRRHIGCSDTVDEIVDEVWQRAIAGGGTDTCNFIIFPNARELLKSQIEKMKTIEVGMTVNCPDGLGVVRSINGEYAYVFIHTFGQRPHKLINLIKANP